jgi:hypothetical protein
MLVHSAMVTFLVVMVTFMVTLAVALGHEAARQE